MRRLGLDQMGGRAFQRVEPLGEAAMQRLPCRLAAELGQDRPHLGEQSRAASPPVAAELAADQVGGLDAVGALVDRRDAGVAIVLGGAGLLDVAHAAMHLDAGRGDLDAEVGAPGLDHRGQQVGPALGADRALSSRRVRPASIAAAAK